MAGTSVAVGEFTVRPGAGYVGSTFEVSLDFDQAVSGLTSVIFLIDGVPLGDPVAVNGLHVSVSHEVPDLEPGTHEISVMSGDSVLARVNFIILEAQPTSSSLFTTIITGLLILTVGALGWQAVRTVRSSSVPGRRLGPIASWRMRRRLPWHR